MTRTALYSTELRRLLSALNREYAKGRPHVESYGSVPVIVYEPYDEGRRHGNFCERSYEAMAARTEWFRRFEKVHSQAKRTLPRADRRWRELDSSCSSDALLMNVFCYPGVWKSARVCAMLGIEVPERPPEFGVRAKVPLRSGRSDRTEVDMKLGGLLVEAKLTESDFQTKNAAVVESYRDLQDAFDTSSLPRVGEDYDCYQLIRNVLAAHANGESFCVIHDARRPDLREQWYRVIAAVRDYELRTRCKVLTWQELSVALPAPLRKFLQEKYGIDAD